MLHCIITPTSTSSDADRNLACVVDFADPSLNVTLFIPNDEGMMQSSANLLQPGRQLTQQASWAGAKGARPASGGAPYLSLPAAALRI